MKNNNSWKNIKVDISELQKDIRGAIHSYLGEYLRDFDIKEWLRTRINKIIKDEIDKTIEKKVYAFLEEAEIEVPQKNYYSAHKITLNDYMIQVIHDFAVNKAAKILEDLTIKIGNKNE